MRFIKATLKSFPLLNSLKQAISGEKIVDAQGNQKSAFDAKEFLIEIAIVAIVIGCVTGKITIEDVKTLHGILKPESNG